MGASAFQEAVFLGRPRDRKVDSRPNCCRRLEGPVCPAVRLAADHAAANGFQFPLPSAADGPTPSKLAGPARAKRSASGGPPRTRHFSVKDWTSASPGPEQAGSHVRAFRLTYRTT